MSSSASCLPQNHVFCIIVMLPSSGIGVPHDLVILDLLLLSGWPSVCLFVTDCSFKTGTHKPIAIVFLNLFYSYFTKSEALWLKKCALLGSSVCSMNLWILLSVVFLLPHSPMFVAGRQCHSGLNLSTLRLLLY